MQIHWKNQHIYNFFIFALMYKIFRAITGSKPARSQTVASRGLSYVLKLLLIRHGLLLFKSLACSPTSPTCCHLGILPFLILIFKRECWHVGMLLSNRDRHSPAVFQLPLQCAMGSPSKRVTQL